MLGKARKAQITVFMIIGIILLVGTGIFFLARSERAGSELSLKALKTAEIRLSTDTVESFVESCLKRTLVEGIYFVAAHGGYYDAPKNYLETEIGDIPYYYDGGRMDIPLIETIENEIGKYIDENIFECLDDFYIFEIKGISVSYLPPKSGITIAENEVSARMEFPITASSLAGAQTTSNFRASAPINLRKPYRTMVELMSDVRVVSLTGLASKDVYVSLVPYDEESIIYSIHDPGSSIYNNELYYIFAARFKDEGVNRPPVMETIPHQLFVVGQNYLLKINAEDPEGDDIEFSVDSALFPINPKTGIIEFTPTENDEGVYDIRITVSDGLNEIYQDIICFVTR